MRSSQRDAEFTEFVAARRPHLRRLAYSLTGDWHQADDLVQIALTKLYVAWPRLRRRDAEDAYARQIILRTSIDESRRPWRRERAGLDGTAEPMADAGDLGGRDELVTALRQLPEMQRKVVVLRHWLGYSVDETARELRLSSGTVKSHTSRGLARLQELLADHAGTEGRA